MTDLLHAFQTSPALFHGTVGFLGLFVGSFLNVVIHRLPIMTERAWRAGLEDVEQADRDRAPGPVTADRSNDIEINGDGTASYGSGGGDESAAVGDVNADDEPFNLAVPRSRCPHCGHRITALQNVPILSWLLLRGRCSSCSAPISARYPLVEAATMMLSLLVAWHFGPTPQALLGIVVTWFLIAMSMIDFDTQYLFDSLTLPLMWIGLLAALVPVFADVQSAVVGAALGYGILWSVYQLFRLITGKEGMGYGDFKLLAAIGALLGWQALPMVILLSSLVGAVVGVTIIAATKRDRSIPIPFGPYLAAAGFIAMLWGEPIMGWYHGLMV